MDMRSVPYLNFVKVSGKLADTFSPFSPTLLTSLLAIIFKVDLQAVTA
jgi:hypothetical protein